MKKILLILLILTPAIASNCSTTLIGVMEEEDGNYTGVIANLTVMIKQGSGNVWVDTMPLTKIETQVSARLAKEVSCELLNINCTNKDFYYYMRSDYPLVGGPSAGSTMTVCTMAALLNTTLNPKVTMTGTINPDGSIGPVGAIIPKAKALKGYDYFLIPDEAVNNNESPIELIKVNDIIEAFNYFTDNNLTIINLSKKSLVNEDYRKAMKLMDTSLLNKAKTLLNGTIANELYNKSKQYYENEEYYSSASYSVRSLIYSFYETNKQLNNSLIKVSELINKISNNVTIFKESFTNKIIIDNLYDLESTAIVMDRIRESEELINESINELNQSINNAIFSASFAQVRLITAKEWSTLLDYFKGTEKINLKITDLKPLAIERIEAARNSITYAQTIVNNLLLTNSINHLDKAIKAYNSDKVMYSLFESMKARAEANLLMGLTGYNNISLRINYNKEMAIRSINNMMSKGYLPLLSLSFLEYSDSFKEEDPYQDLLFLAYSKEFATLSQSLNEQINYLKMADKPFFKLKQSFNETPFKQLLILIIGFLLGIVITSISLKKDKT